MSAQTVSVCVVCGAQTDRFLCGDDRAGTGCLGELLRQLGNTAALVDELNLVLSRRNKSGGTSVGYISNGGDEQPIPINTKAMEVGLWLRDRLCSWARLLWEDNAPREADGSVPAIDVDLGIVSVSRWLMRHPTWIALCPAADELYAELTEDLRAAWRVAHFATPTTVYVGLCHAVIEGEECVEDLYAREDAWTVSCRTCGTEHDDVQERREGLAYAVEHQYVPVGVLVGLVTDRGLRLTTAMVRNLKARRRIAAYVNIPDGGQGAGVIDRYGFRVRPWTSEDASAERLYNVGAVLDAIATKWARQAA